MDRSVGKILLLPLFTDEFCQWLVNLRMVHFEKLSAVSDDSIAECVQSFVDLVPALEDVHAPSSRQTEEEIFRWVPSIELLFTLVRSMSVRDRKSRASYRTTDLGFGIAGRPIFSGRSPLKAIQLVPVPLAKSDRHQPRRAKVFIQSTGGKLANGECLKRRSWIGAVLMRRSQESRKPGPFFRRTR